MNDRIRMVRDELDLSRAAFGKNLGVSGDVINNLERGRVDIKDSMVKLICSAYSVREAWLRTGEGEMFVQRTKEDELSAAVERLMSGESAEFKSRLVRVLASLDEKYWVILEEKLKEIVGMQDVSPAAPSTTKLYVAARDGSRVEAEIDDDFTIPENDTELPE